MTAKKRKEPKSIKELMQSKEFKNMLDKKKHVKFEFQDYGVRLSHKLNDPKHKSLYIKLAKEENRSLLEQAYRFAVDYPKMDGKNKGRLFMWKLKELREERKEKKKEDEKKAEEEKGSLL